MDYNLPSTTAVSQGSTEIEWGVFESLLARVNDTNPVIPESVVAYFMAKSGCMTSDPNVLKLIAASTHLFLFNVIRDAQAFRVLRTGEEDEKAMLTMQDLMHSLHEKGIVLAKPSYYVG